MKKTYCILLTILLIVSLNACKNMKNVNSFNITEVANEKTIHTTTEVITEPIMTTVPDTLPFTPDMPTAPLATDSTEPVNREGTEPSEPPKPVPTNPSEPEDIEPSDPSQPKPTDPSAHIHKFGNYEVNAWRMPTETRPGGIYRFCECGYRDAREIPSLNYNVTDPITGEHICVLYATSIPATCIRPQYSLTRCTGCDYTSEYNGSSTQLANHAYSNWSVTKEATATEQGERSRTCSLCGKVNVEIIPASNEQREYYIDPRLEIDVLPDGVTSYRSYLLQLSVIDTRTWGDPPSIYIIDDSYLRIVYYQQDGTKVYYSLKPVEGYFNRFVIFENGTYKTQLIGDYND